MGNRFTIDKRHPTQEQLFQLLANLPCCPNVALILPSDELSTSHLLIKMSSPSSSGSHPTSPNIFFLLLILSSNLTLASDFPASPQWQPVNRTHLALSATIPEYAKNIHAIGLYRRGKFIARSAIPDHRKKQLVKFVAELNPCSTYEPSFTVRVAFQGRGANRDYCKTSSRFGYTPGVEVKCSNGQLLLKLKGSVQGSGSEEMQWWLIYTAIGGAILLILLFIIALVGIIICCCRKRSNEMEVETEKYESWNTKDFDGKTVFNYRKATENRKMRKGCLM